MKNLYATLLATGLAILPLTTRAQTNIPQRPDYSQLFLQSSNSVQYFSLAISELYKLEERPALNSLIKTFEKMVKEYGFEVVDKKRLEARGKTKGEIPAEIYKNIDNLVDIISRAIPSK